MRIRRFFLVENYISRFKTLEKSFKVFLLARKNFSNSNINFFWKVNPGDITSVQFSSELSWHIFNKKLNLNDLDWHKDYISGFTFPRLRFNKIKLQNWYNKGIEVKFPWELSRFNFAVNLGQKYLITNDDIYYKNFRVLILDWIKRNPFLYGVNWVSSMEVAIRAVNWIIAANLFESLLEKDELFKKTLSVSLAQHAEYLSNFPEIYAEGLTTNHTVACYSGLLFLALTLNDNHKAGQWLILANKGLEECMTDQVYADGGDFEASIPYHRLVLEMFAFSTIASLANENKFSTMFYSKLFRMFEFSAACIDSSGNAPQIGDNDSGRFIVLNSLNNNNPYADDHNHSYLLDLGEAIFNYKFLSSYSERNNFVTKFIPAPERLEIRKLNIKPRITSSSVKFDESEIYLLKNDDVTLLFSSCPLGQKGKGGHNHYDKGSYTLSLKGKQVVVDPGTFTYTSSKNKRNKFREYSYHNTLFTDLDNQINWSGIDYWQLKDFYDCDVLSFDEKELYAIVKFIGDKIPRYRRFRLMSSSLEITDEYPGFFYSRINLYPGLTIKQKNGSIFEFETFNVVIENAKNINVSEYDFSLHYGHIVKAQFFLVSAFEYLRITFHSKL